MLKKAGDKVKEGENIAFYSALFGLLKKNVPSPRDGVIESDLGGHGAGDYQGVAHPG